MKLEGLHGQETAKRGTCNLARVSRKKSCSSLCSRVSVRRAPGRQEFPLGLRTAKRLLTCAQHDHFAQHRQAIPEKANFATLGMVPLHWNLANPQTDPTRQKKQLNIEREAFDPRRFKNRPAHFEAKRFESALRIPKR